MATEEQLIRKLRILYGISPEGADRQSFDLDIRGIEDRMAGLPATIQRTVRGVGANRDRVETVANPELAALRRQLEEIRGRQVAAPDGSEISEAKQNAGLLDSIFSGIRKSTLDDGTRELNNRFTNTLRTTNSGLAARGLTGGSAARSAQGRTLADLLLGRQRLAGAADAADQTSRASLDEQRQQTERQIKLGTQPDVSTINTLQQAQAGLNESYRGLTEQALGSLLVTGSNSYRDINQADATGRRGWGSLAPTAGRTGSAGGNIY